MSKCLNEMSFKDIIETKLHDSFNDYSDNYDHETEDNYVPYGDTYVSSGEYITDESYERCVEDFKENFDIATASEFVTDILAEDNDFLMKVIELVKATRL